MNGREVRVAGNSAKSMYLTVARVSRYDHSLSSSYNAGLDVILCTKSCASGWTEHLPDQYPLLVDGTEIVYSFDIAA